MIHETDRELLELAAKAAGIKAGFTDSPKDGCYLIENGESAGWWNPLTDDGDAFRLAIDLRLTVLEASVRKPNGDVVNVFPGEAPDRYAATRRAIVRAAAEIGRAMP